MKNKVIIFSQLMLGLSLIINNLHAQESLHSIAGVVQVNQSGEPLKNAFVELFKMSDSTFVFAQNTDDQGNFKISRIEKEKYFMRISHPLYAVYISKPINLVHNVSNKIFSLEENTNELDEVIVEATRPIAVLDGDKKSIYVERIPGIEGDNGIELLGKLPGFWIENESSIAFNGSSEVTILINGRRQGFKNSQDLNLLKTIPANNIKKIEVISGGSAKYDADRGTIVNIITKNKAVDGLSVNLSSYSYVNEEISDFQNAYVNLVSGRFSGSASVGYRNSKSYGTENGNIFYDNSDEDTQQDYLKNYDIDSKVLSLYSNLNYKIDQSNELNFNFSSYSTNKQTNIQQQNSYYGEQNFILKFKNLKNAEDNLTSMNLSHTYTKDSSDFKIKSNIGYLTGFIDETQNFENKFITGSTIDSLNKGRAEIPLDGHQFIMGLDFEIPVSVFLIEAGAKYTDSEIENNATYFDDIDGLEMLNGSRSDSLIYDEKVFAGYSLLSTSVGNMSFKGGVRIEHTENASAFLSTQTISANSYTNFLPNFVVSYKTKNLSSALKFTSGLTRPDYVYLNPYEYYISEFSYRVGNPDLKPVKRNTISLENSLFDFLDIDLGYHRYNDMIMLVSRRLENSLYTRTRPENATSINDFYASVGIYYRLLDNKWSGQLSFYGETYNYDIKPQFVTDTRDLDQFQYYSVKFNNSYEITPNIEIFNRFSYRSNSTFYQIYQASRWRLDLGVTGNLFNDSLKITAGVDDIFNTYNYDNISYFDGYQNNYETDLSLTRFKLSVVYSFSTGWNKNKKSTSTDNSKEITRFKN
ncbi:MULTISPECIES: outer membrane beta-barrel protein [Galbibacter]|uniref:TonB-dependent receptor n=1 Tax=Galbibacter pacificus TaxID=2996052 RepID=A0ABT6FSC9_9FLAO|nr:outer membrane beta-barrel protein [Galbibacter pacificus]MDG3582869.1 TonB-dependent receptor [Galbibacter pacificus]MDG3586012.1 TonB-dependent receptor [Galbibacter pacificus]